MPASTPSRPIRRRSVGRVLLVVLVVALGAVAAPSGAAVAAPTAPGSQTFRNPNTYLIPDLVTVSSPITSTLTGTVPSVVRAAVNIQHTYIGDLRVQLVAPDGVVFTLHNRTGGAANDLIATYTVNASGRPAGGTWILRIRDMAPLDVGYLRAWSITFP